jgi:hypothetical protein
MAGDNVARRTVGVARIRIAREDGPAVADARMSQIHPGWSVGEHGAVGGGWAAGRQQPSGGHASASWADSPLRAMGGKAHRDLTQLLDNYEHAIRAHNSAGRPSV